MPVMGFMPGGMVFGSMSEGFCDCFAMKLSLLAAGLAFTVSAFAADWWVDANNGVDAVGRGGEKTPFRTLQYAHNAAAENDVVHVLPGDYHEGYGVDVSVAAYAHTNRLWVTKKLSFISTGGAAVTTIRGQHDTVSDSGGEGPFAIRCVGCKYTAAGSLFKGFTFADGASHNTGDENLLNYGGGFGVDNYYSYSFDKSMGVFKFYVLDSVFTNCVAKWGPGMRGGTAIRCRFVDNIGDSFGQAACGTALWNCLVEHQRALRTDRPAFGNCTIAVNCTIHDVPSQAGNHRVKCLNCVFSSCRVALSAYSAGNVSDPTYATNCFGDVENAFFVDHTPYLFMSPATDDYRLTAGSCAVNGGKTEFLTSAIVLPEGLEMTDFAGRPLDLSKNTCQAGCIQEVATPASGVVRMDEGACVAGRRAHYQTYARTSTWPATVALTPCADKGTLFRFREAVSSLGGTVFRYLTYDDVVYAVPPRDPSQCAAVTPVYAATQIWCDPAADAAVADGTSDKPYRTLQAALDAVTKANTIVYARPGVYAEGERTALDFSNRVVIPAGYPLLVKSTGGAAVTTIRGRAATEQPYPVNYPGCGPDAMRCLAVLDNVDNSRAIQGFTFEDGHGCATNGSYVIDVVADRCGGVYGSGRDNFQVLDCVFTNCTAVRGGAFYNATAKRCVLDDCHGVGAVTRYGALASCIVKPSCTIGVVPPGATPNHVVGTETRLYFSVAPMDSISDKEPNEAYGKFGNLYRNSSVLGCYYWGSVFNKAIYLSDKALGYAMAEDGFVDFDGGDYRVYSFAASRTAANVPTPDEAGAQYYEKALVFYFDSGFDGAPLTVTGGKPLPGAYQRLVPALRINGEATALVVTGGTAVDGNTYLLDADDTITIAPSANRALVGLSVNGEEVGFAEHGGTLSFTAADALASPLAVCPVYAADVYVDANNGNDANDGLSPDAAFKTLAVALSHVGDGCTVHAAPGRYEQGTGLSIFSSEGDIRSRAVVPPGVRLVADAGPEQTFIVGAEATQNRDAYGRGDDAVRCVFLGAGATVRGFTLEGGRTRAQTSDSFDSCAGKPAWQGAGVLSAVLERADVARARVENCIVSNCVAICGGAGFRVTFQGSRLFRCRATRGSAVERCGLVSCAVNDMDSEGGTGICVNNTFACRNVTIGPDIRRDGGGGSALYRQWSDNYGYTNVLVLGGNVYGINANASHCVFPVGVSVAGLDCCTNIARAACAVDLATFRPADASPLVDLGVVVPGDETDLHGGQRVYNGRTDVGAVEVDWRPQYAVELGARGFTVTAAAPDVVRQDQGVVAIAKGALAGTWTNPRAPKPATFCGQAEVMGTGTLTIAWGADTLVYTAADGAQIFTIQSSAPATDVTFTYVPGADDTGAALLSGFVRRVGLSVTFR